MKTQKQILYDQFKPYIDKNIFDYMCNEKLNYEIISIKVLSNSEITVYNSYDENHYVCCTKIEYIYNDKCETKKFTNNLNNYNLPLHNPATWMDIIFILVFHNDNCDT